jgi:ribosomal protein L3 glutamine methyltransferase
MSELTELQTIRDMVRWAVSRFHEAGIFYGHGTESAWDEAIALVLHTLYLPHDISPTILDARITSAEREALLKLIQRRVTERVPVPYLTHEAWFAGIPFYVDERVLIPRSPFAELIENDFQPWLDSVEEVHTILDLCTGSGCIAIACANQFPEAEIDASDISADAIAVAKINVLRHGVEDQVHLHQSDLFANLPPKKYDLIISNPPYVDEGDMAALPDEYRHEPALGLEAGVDGLDIALRILQEAPQYLQPHGVLIIEVGNSEYALAERFPEIPFTWVEFQRGGGGVFLLTASQLAACQHLLSSES